MKPDKSFGFIRVGAAIPEVRVADCEFNATQIVGLIKKAEAKDVQILVFPELSITAYTCGDLFRQRQLIRTAETQLARILKETKHTNVIALLGMPISCCDSLYNCAVVIQKGTILGVVPKSNITARGESGEARWFSSGTSLKSYHLEIIYQNVPFGTDLLFKDSQDDRICFGIEIGGDLWIPIPPSTYQAMEGAMLLFNLSASNDLAGKNSYRRALVSQQSARCMSGYVCVSSGTGESTTDLVFGGSAIICENGSVLKEAERFSDIGQLIYSDIDLERLLADRTGNTSLMYERPAKSFRTVEFEIAEFDAAGFDQAEFDAAGFGQAEFERKEDIEHLHAKVLERKIEPFPFIPVDEKSKDEGCSEIFSIQTAGLAKRMRHTGSKRAVIGISGGLDSTLALLVTAKTFDLLGLDRSNIIAVTMPGFGTTDESYNNAMDLMKTLKVTAREIDIKSACMVHFQNIGHDTLTLDAAYENAQARERTQVLMDIANMENGLVIGTGDLSELALGWATYNGDHMSMYAVNCSVPKTLVRSLINWVAVNASDEKTRYILYRILSAPISPELLPPDSEGKTGQVTETLVGPYELHDFFLFYMVRYGFSPLKILYLANHAFKDKYSNDTIQKWLKVFIKRFFSQQFKRSCMPDGPMVGSVSLSPRGSWCMPSDASAEIWLKELD